MSGKPKRQAPFGDTERQASELAAMRRMLRVSRGTFSFSVAICNSPALRDYLIERLGSDDEAIELVVLPNRIDDVYATVKRLAHDTSRSALFVVNLEKSLPSVADKDADSQVLRHLNGTRALWRDSYAGPLVFWVPEYAAALLSTRARDLWAWRSHQFEFVAEAAEPTAGMAPSFAGDILSASNLDADRKRFRMAELEERIAQSGNPPPDELAGHVSTWISELAFLWKTVGDLDRAEEMIRKSLDINEKLGRLEGMASDYGNLGVICTTRGDLDRAEEMIRKSLDINEKLGRPGGIAVNYGNLGVIYQMQSDLDRAEEMHSKSLDIEEKLGRLEGMASESGNLGLIYKTRGDLDRAEEMLLKSLDINEKLGRLEGMASQYGNLGLVYETRGDLDRAEEMLLKSLDIEEKLGRLEGMASDYGNLGLIHQTRGDLDRAEEMLLKSLDINEKIGRLVGMAGNYSNLGLVYQTRSDLDRAEEMLLKSLDINKKLGRFEGMASDYGNLGVIYKKCGDLDRAEENHRKSLGIEEKLGRLVGMANQYGNLGSIYGMRGDLDRACDLLVKARDLFTQIGMSHMVDKTQKLIDETVGETEIS